MTFRITAIALVIFALDTPAFAGGKIGEIRQIDTAQGMAAVSVRGKVREGDSLIATAKDATQCSLMVRSLKGSIAMVDISSCSFGQQLKVCLLYTSDAADERSSVDLGGRRIIKKKKKQER